MSSTTPPPAVPGVMRTCPPLPPMPPQIIRLLPAFLCCLFFTDGRLRIILEGWALLWCQCIVSGAPQIQGWSFILNTSSHSLALAIRHLKGETPRGRLDPWVRKIPWSRKWQLTQYPCLENTTDRGVQQAIVCGVTKSRTWLSNWAHTHWLFLPVFSKGECWYQGKGWENQLSYWLKTKENEPTL